jgi:hypothetical protein
VATAPQICRLAAQSLRKKLATVTVYPTVQLPVLYESTMAAAVNEIHSDAGGQMLIEMRGDNRIVRSCNNMCAHIG